MRSTVLRIIPVSAGLLAFGLAFAVDQAPKEKNLRVGQTQPVALNQPAANPQQPIKPPQNIEASIQPSGVRYESGGRRDPFLSPIVPKKKEENPDEEVPRGSQPPGIGGMFMAQVKLLGIVFNGTPTAVLQGTDRRAYFLQEKDKLFDGYIKKIEPDSVILIRETKLRSGKVVTQEVTKRLRTP